jgi:minor extracellular serine protease Vpr
MKLLRLAAALGALASLAAAWPSAAQEALTPLVPPPSAETGAFVNETPQFWFIELSSPPTADGTSLATVRNEKAAFRSAAAKAGIKYTERYAFDTLFNGFSVRVSPGELVKIARLSGVKAVYPVGKIAMPAPSPVLDPELVTAITMTGADVAHSELGLTGAGVKVAVMDTGIDYNHPDLGGCFGPGCRVAYGTDLVGDAYNADDADPIITPDNNPDDCAGHGTHVSGIIGANGQVVGVAPGVTFGAYRVFGCVGSTSDDVMIAAMERALADGMQVLNMSIGSAFDWPQAPTAKAASRLVDKGMVVVASIGNSGASGLYSAGSPGLGDKVIGVASFDNVSINGLPSFTVSGVAGNIGYIAATGAPNPPTSGTSPMTRTSTVNNPPADACGTPTPGVLAGKVALIRRGTCSFYQKAKFAEAEGAIAVVLYNNTSGIVNATVAGSPPVGIPVVGISNTKGAAINAAIVAHPTTTTITWTTDLASEVNPTGGLISSFSSYGLSPDLALKPDIGAPGGFIRSTWPLELGGYAVLSGTSMASPHVAGAAALVLQAKPRTNAHDMRGILQNTAVPAPWFGNPGLGFLDNVHRQGAGMVKIDKAATSTVSVTPSKVALGESQFGGSTQAFTVTNNGSEAVSYALSSTNALATGGSDFAPSFFTSNTAVAFSTPSITVPAGGSATFSATFTPPTNDPAFSMYGGYIKLTPADDGQVYRVPFGGFVGDYQAKPVLTSGGAAGFPWLADSTLAGNLADGGTFTMTGDDVAYIVFHLDHQARKFELDIQDANTGKSWHEAFQWEFTTRNSTSTGAFVLTWDGVTFAGNRMYVLPNGQYRATITVTKALGDSTTAETWTSPVITIARP